MSDKKCCFIISPIGEPESDTRKRSDQVLKHIIKPALEACGYKGQRADEIDKPGIITSQVIQRVVNDPLVIADLTERNPNVFYELAIRHAIKKPLVQIIKKGERIPFDVAGTRTIQVDHKDLDSVEEAKQEIINQIRELEKSPSDVETPISVSLDLQMLRQSEKPEERSLADLLSTVSELRTSITKLETRMGTQDSKGILDEINDKLNSLPRRFEELFEMGSPFNMRRRRISPMMLKDMVRMSSKEEGSYLGILVLSSLFKDSMPWLYELGLDAFKRVREGDIPAARESLDAFRRMLDFSMHSKMSRELFPYDKEMMMVSEDLFMYMEDLIQNSKKVLDRKSKRVE